MREEIALWYFGFSSWEGVDPRLRAFLYRHTDKLLGIIRGEIEKVETPGGFEKDIEIYESCRRDILSLFSEGE